MSSYAREHFEQCLIQPQRLLYVQEAASIYRRIV